MNIEKIVYYLKRGGLQSSEDKFITMKELNNCGAIKNPKFGVKLLSKGLEMLKDCPALFIEVSQASDSVIKEIQKLGGKVGRKGNRRSESSS